MRGTAAAQNAALLQTVVTASTPTETPTLGAAPGKAKLLLEQAVVPPPSLRRKNAGGKGKQQASAKKLKTQAKVDSQESVTELMSSAALSVGAEESDADSDDDDSDDDDGDDSDDSVEQFRRRMMNGDGIDV